MIAGSDSVITDVIPLSELAWFGIKIEFSEFPTSYFFAQRSIAAALACSIFVRPFFGPNAPPLARNPAGMIFILVMIVALLASFYVIVRYPFISLVEPADGDEFSKNYGRNPIVYKVVNCLAILTIAMILVGMIVGGIHDSRLGWTLAYAVPLLSFLLFHLFCYDPVRHPTVGTFLRSTLGIGVLLLPLYLPAILIGSYRCGKLLDRFDQNAG
ncbi:MAG: hypothetical protein OSA89_16475 [Mariniblastus sp.]|nr:hypothetical protein [Mariniblastus sp.]